MDVSSLTIYAGGTISRSVSGHPRRIKTPLGPNCEQQKRACTMGSRSMNGDIPATTQSSVREANLEDPPCIGFEWSGATTAAPSTKACSAPRGGYVVHSLVPSWIGGIATRGLGCVLLGFVGDYDLYLLPGIRGLAVGLWCPTDRSRRAESR